MNLKVFYILFILVFLNTSLLSKDLTIEELNEIKRGLKSNEITIEQLRIIKERQQNDSNKILSLQSTKQKYLQQIGQQKLRLTLYDLNFSLNIFY